MNELPRRLFNAKELFSALASDADTSTNIINLTRDHVRGRRTSATFDERIFCAAVASHALLCALVTRSCTPDSRWVNAEQTMLTRYSCPRDILDKIRWVVPEQSLTAETKNACAIARLLQTIWAEAAAIASAYESTTTGGQVNVHRLRQQIGLGVSRPIAVADHPLTLQDIEQVPLPCVKDGMRALLTDYDRLKYKYRLFIGTLLSQFVPAEQVQGLIQRRFDAVGKKVSEPLSRYTDMLVTPSCSTLRKWGMCPMLGLHDNDLVQTWQACDQLYIDDREHQAEDRMGMRVQLSLRKARLGTIPENVG